MLFELADCSFVSHRSQCPLVLPGRAVLRGLQERSKPEEKQLYRSVHNLKRSPRYSGSYLEVGSYPRPHPVFQCCTLKACNRVRPGYKANLEVSLGRIREQAIPYI